MVPCVVSDDLLIVLIRNELEGTITKGHHYVNSCVNILRQFFSSSLYPILLIYLFSFNSKTSLP